MQLVEVHISSRHMMGLDHGDDNMLMTTNEWLASCIYSSRHSFNFLQQILI
jgi:hypothetical protein